MRHALFVLFAVMILAGVSGCLHNQVASNGGPSVQACGRAARCWPPCGACGGGGLGRDRDRGRAGPALAPQQPPVAAITYPYYTLRGPRDFLERTPTPIGP
jgi:hypothetical protein